MLSFAGGILSLVAAASVADANSPPDVLTKDVVIVGGGASGAYAAVRLREDFGKSIVPIEKEKILGGHVDSWTDPKTGIPYDCGVKSFIDAGNATNFFERLGIPTGESPNVPVTTQYIDFKTGKVVDFDAPDITVQFDTLQNFLPPAEKYESLIQSPGYFNFPEPEDIPEDLLMTFGEFATKYQFEKAMPFIYSSTGMGLGNMTQALTLFGLQAFGASMARASLGLQGLFVPASLRNQDLYDAVAELLGDDVQYSSTVVNSRRADNGVSVTVKNHETGKETHITAKRLLIAIEPTNDHMASFDLDKNEHEVLSTFTFSRLYTGIIDNPNLMVNMSYFNLPPSAAPDDDLALPDASFTARIDYLGSGPYFRVTVIGDDCLDPSGAKKLVQRDFNTLIKSGILESADDNTVHWVDFSVHGPMHARVGIEDIKAGFFQKLNALQGGRSTWWTGGAWARNFQTHLWQYDETIMPMLLKGLD